MTPRGSIGIFLVRAWASFEGAPPTCIADSAGDLGTESRENHELFFYDFDHLHSQEVFPAVDLSIGSL